jgi:hypothetical protein
MFDLHLWYFYADRVILERVRSLFRGSTHGTVRVLVAIF